MHLELIRKPTIHSTTPTTFQRAFATVSSVQFGSSSWFAHTARTFHVQYSHSTPPISIQQVYSQGKLHYFLGTKLVYYYEQKKNRNTILKGNPEDCAVTLVKSLKSLFPSQIKKAALIRKKRRFIRLFRRFKDQCLFYVSGKMILIQTDALRHPTEVLDVDYHGINVIFLYK